jgi:hypothetical protein
MGQRITVSKAAKLLGIKRSELNKRLLAANIETFEGDVDLEKVKCIAPTLKVDGAGVLDERVRYLRENVAKPTIRDAVTERQDMESEVRRLSSELIVETQMANHYRDILEDVGRKLGELQMSDNAEAREFGFEFCEWLRKRIAEN